MVRHRVEAVRVVDAVGDRVEEGVFLGVQRAGFDLRDGLRQIHDPRHSTQQFERAGLYRAGRDTNRHARQIGGAANWPHVVGHMPEAAFEPTKTPIVHPRVDARGRRLTELPIHGGASRRQIAARAGPA